MRKFVAVPAVDEKNQHRTKYAVNEHVLLGQWDNLKKSDRRRKKALDKYIFHIYVYTGEKKM